MKPPRHPLAEPQVLLLLAVSLCSGLAMGYFSPLLTALMKDRGESEVEVGLVGTAYYLLVAAGALLAGATALRGRRAVGLGLAFAGFFGLLTPYTRSTLELGLARAGGGLAVGVYSTMVQAALLARTTTRSRAVITASQALSFGLGLALGPILGALLYSAGPRVAFAAGGLPLLLAAAGTLASPERLVEAERAALRATFRKVVFPLGAAFAFGFAEAVFLSLYPLSLLERNVPMRTMATSCSAFVLAGLVSTLPVALAADRLGRRRVLVACCLAGVAAMVGLAFVEAPGPLVALSVLGGASLGPVYALALSLVRDGLGEDEVGSGAAAFNGSFSLGCIAGPVASAVAMHALGPPGVLAPVVALFMLVLFHAALDRRSARAPSGWAAKPGGAADP